jgi:hypothetical protein
MSLVTLAINAIVTTDDTVVTVSYELSLEDVPEQFHDEIVSIITLSINPNDNDPMMVITSEELSENMGNVFMEELVVAITAINLDIEELLSTTATEEKEESKMNEATNTTSATTQPVEDVTPKSEVPDLAAAIERMKKQQEKIDNHDKRLDDLEAKVKNLSGQVNRDSSLGLSGWATVAAVCGGIAGVGYYFGRR